MSDSADWILLVEDDPIFSMLFCRTWRAAFPHVAIREASCLAAMQSLLDGAQTKPRLVVMDRTLPDGDGHLVAPGLNLPNHCWSALGESGATAKPQGKPALEASVQMLATLAGL